MIIRWLRQTDTETRNPIEPRSLPNQHLMRMDKERATGNGLTPSKASEVYYEHEKKKTNKLTAAITTTTASIFHTHRIYSGAVFRHRRPAIVFIQIKLWCNQESARLEYQLRFDFRDGTFKFAIAYIRRPAGLNLVWFFCPVTRLHSTPEQNT